MAATTLNLILGLHSPKVYTNRQFSYVAFETRIGVINFSCLMPRQATVLRFAPEKVAAFRGK